jgi:hypothetical protein
VLAGDREDAVLDLDIDVLCLDPGDVRADDQVLLVALDVDRRRPRTVLTVEPLVVCTLEGDLGVRT